MFSIIQEETDNVEEVVASNVTIKHFNAYVLFDCNAMHLFISKIFARYLGNNLITLKQPYRVATPRGDVLVANFMYSNYDVDLGGG